MPSLLGEKFSKIYKCELNRVPLIIPGIIGRHQFRYPKEDNKWRPDTRQDIFTQPRYYLWKPHLPPVYSNPKNPLVPAAMAINYNRYGFPPLPSVLQHPNYMFTMPTTKVNSYPYRTIKDLGTKSKPGNFHHITIINAIMPKPYMPLPTMSFQNGQQVLRSHRNNKQLFYYHMNTGRPAGNANRTRNSPHQQTPHMKQHGHLMENMSDEIPPTTGHQPTSTYYSTNAQNANQNTNNGEVRAGTFQCAQRTSSGYSQLNTNAPNYYCNMVNFYENETNKRDIQQQQAPPTTASATSITSSENPRDDMKGYTSPKSIFLPTTYEPHLNIFAETTTKHNKREGNTILRATTIVPSLTRSDTHEHNFFTIEDAITSAPPRNYVFNDPYEALSHARKRKELHSKQQTKKYSGARTEKNSLFINFFDDKAETTSEMQSYNRSRFYSPAPYFSYSNEGVNTNHDSMIEANNPFAELYGHKPNTDGRWQHLHTTPFSDSRFDKSTTTTESNLYGTFSEKTTVSSEVTKTTSATTLTTEHEDNKTEGATSQSTSEMPIITTSATRSTTTRSKVKKSRLKHPFYGRPTPAYKTHKPSSGLLTALRNSTYPSTTPVSNKKKSHKYQRQYKPKKSKLLKTLLPTTSSPVTLAQSTASTTIATTTKEAHITSKIAFRTITGISPTETATTKASKTHSERPLANQTRDSQRLKSSKRNEKGRNVTTTKPRSSKNRRRFYTSSTTSKSLSMSPLGVTTPSIAPTSLSSYTATTMKPHTRKSSTQSKANLHTLKTSPKTPPNEVNAYSAPGSKQSPRTVKPTSPRDGGVPPLPIEIYFKKSQNTQI